MTHSIFLHRHPASPHPSTPHNFGLLRLCPLCILFSLFLASTVGAQTRPLIHWMQGGHAGSVLGAALTPDGSLFVTAGGDKTVKIRRTVDGILIRTIPAQSVAAVSAFALSPDGTQIVSSAAGGSDGIRIWRISDGAMLQSWSTIAIIRTLAWSPDGTRIAVGLGGSMPSDYVIQIRSASDGNILTTLTGHTSYISALAFSPDSSRLVSGGADKTVRIWNPIDGSLLQTFTDHTDLIHSVVYAPDNRTIASGSEDGTIKLWDASAGQLLRSLSAGRTNSVAFAPSGAVLASGDADSHVFLWNVANGALLHSDTLGPDATPLASVCYSQDGTQLLAIGQQNESALYHSADLTMSHTLPSEHNNSVLTVGVTPNGNHIVSVAGTESRIRIWNASNGALERSMPNVGFHNYYAMAVSPDNASFVTTDQNYQLRIWSVNTGAVLLNKTIDAQAEAVAWSIDSKQIFYTTPYATGGPAITVVNSADISSVTSLHGHTDIVLALAVSPDGKMLASASRDKTVKLWRLSDYSLLKTLTGHTGYVVSVAFSADSSKVIAGSQDNSAILWDVTSGAPLHTFAHSGSVVGVALAPDGQTAATGSLDGHLRIWKQSTGALLSDYTEEVGFTTHPLYESSTMLTYTSDDANILYSRSDGAIVSVANTNWVPTITGVTVTPNNVFGGLPSTGTVTIDQPAHQGGSVVMLSSDSSIASFQATAITIPEGATSAPFVINTTPVAVPTNINIIASNSDTTASAVLTVNPPAVTGLSVSPTTVKGGASATGTVTVNLPAPVGGVTATLTSADTSIASVPTSVTIPSGATSATFTVTTHTVGSTRTVSLSAVLGGTASASLTVTPPDVIGLTLSPTSVKGTLTSTGTIAIADAAPAGGIVVNLSSSNTNVATVPASVTIASGSKTATFTITSKAVAADTVVTISGVFNSQTKTATLTVLTPVIAGITVNPTVVRSLQTATATVSIDAPAPTGGLTLPLLSTNTATATLPASVTIPAGAKTASVTVTTSLVTTDTRLLLAATLGVNSQTAAFTVVPHLPFDFDNDGHNDLVLQNQVSNLGYLWFTNGLTILGGTTLNSTPPAGWQLVGAGDANHDGYPDLFLQNQSTNRVAIWYLLGTLVEGGQELSLQPSPGYKVVGIGDFSGDGRPDILFQHNTTGRMVIWVLNDYTVISSVTIPQLQIAGYQVVGVGDMDGDGKPDIIFQHQTTNQVAIWYMNGGTFTGNGGLTSQNPASGWQVKGVEDLNGDGKADLIFQNQTTGQLSVWYMNGQTVTGGGNMSITPPTDYKLRGPH